MSIKLDFNRKKGIVYGDAEERYYQDGSFFDGQGKFLRSASGRPPEPVDDEDPPGVAEPQDAGKAERIKELSTKSVAELRKLVARISEATGIAGPKEGLGAKARYVTYIADHTTD